MKIVFFISIFFMPLNVTNTFAINFQDEVYLKNGIVTKGQIVKQNQNGDVTIETEFKDVFVYNYDEIESITQNLDSNETIIDHIASGVGVVEIHLKDGRVRHGTVTEKYETGNIKLQTKNGKLVILYPDIKTIIQKPININKEKKEDGFYLDPLKDQSLSGPRFGMTLLSNGLADVYEKAFGEKASYITQFGWQFEKRMGETRKGFNGLYETIFLIAGLERGKVMGSASFLVGMRNLESGEFAFGPNVSILQDKNENLQINSGMVIAAGKTHSFGNVMVPVNLALVIFKYGARLSILGGFNSRSR